MSTYLSCCVQSAAATITDKSQKEGSAEWSVGSYAGAGSSGVGKSAVMQHLLQQQSLSGAMMSSTLTFSAQTTSIATQELIEAKLERRHRNRQVFHTRVAMLGATSVCNLQVKHEAVMIADKILQHSMNMTACWLPCWM